MAAGGDALTVALDLYAQPHKVALWRSMPLPRDVGTLLRVASHQPESLQRATDSTGVAPEELVAAARFFVEQLMLARDVAHDPWRVLGVSPGAPESTLREHRHWLLRLVHPDRSPDWADAYAMRVQNAWKSLRGGPEAASLEAGPEASHAPGPQQADSVDWDAGRPVVPEAWMAVSPPVPELEVAAPRWSGRLAYAGALLLVVAVLLGGPMIEESLRPDDLAALGGGGGYIEHADPAEMSGVDGKVHAASPESQPEATDGIVAGQPTPSGLAANSSESGAAVARRTHEDLPEPTPPQVMAERIIPAGAQDRPSDDCRSGPCDDDRTASTRTAVQTSVQQNQADQGSADQDLPVAPVSKARPVIEAGTAGGTQLVEVQSGPGQSGPAAPSGAGSRSGRVAVATTAEDLPSHADTVAPVHAPVSPAASNQEPVVQVAETAGVARAAASAIEPSAVVRDPMAAAFQDAPSEVAVAGPAVGTPDAAPRPTSSGSAPTLNEALALVGAFKQAYSETDMAGLLALFSAQAHAGRGGRASLAADYSRLFRSSTARSIEFRALRWRVEGASLVGTGSYEVRLTRSDRLFTQKLAGEVRLEVVRQPDGVRFLWLEPRRSAS